MPATAFDDLANDIDAAPAAAPKPEAPTLNVFTEKCPKCSGSGLYRAPSTYGVRCFKCGGRGVLTFKTSAETRRRGREKAAERAQRKVADLLQAFKTRYPAEAEWIAQAGGRGFGFADSMQLALNTYGCLTHGQIAAVHRCMAADADRQAKMAEERAAAEATAPTVEIGRVAEAFAHAMSKGIKRPKLRLGEFLFKPAPAGGVNAGAIYVTRRPRPLDDEYEGAYLGKIAGGRFIKSRECSAELESQVVEAAGNPEAAAIAYGKRYGQCAVCARPLENTDSIERGIGPICAEKMGW